MTAAVFSSESVEWYTPADYVESARKVLGGIDLDPASCELANRTVRAATFYTRDDDGLARPWAGRVWLNPPYGVDGGRSRQAQWSQRLIAAYDAGDVEAAVLLVGAVVERRWFQPLWRFPVCLTDHRVRFYRPDGAADSPVTGSALVYLGTNPRLFAREFARYGQIVTPSRNACAECGGPILGRADRVTCSSACRQRAYRRRRGA